MSHEVVPGHVTTFAYLQNLYWRGLAGFEASVLTMNTRAATLFEGIANNAILMAYGVTEVDQLPDEDLQIGVLLALLQDDAKNQSSYLTWGKESRRLKWPRCCATSFWCPPNGRTNCRARGDGIRYWAGCTCRPIVRGPNAWPSCGVSMRRRNCCRRCMGVWV